MRHSNRGPVPVEPESSRTVTPAGMPTIADDRHLALQHLEWSVTQISQLLGQRGSGPLTPAQLQAMRFLVDAGPSSVGSVARAIGASLSSTTGLIDRLQQLGLVDRDRSEVDRRTVTVTATEEGTRVVREILEDRIGLLNQVFLGLGVDNLWMLHELLHRAAVSNTAAIEVS